MPYRIAKEIYRTILSAKGIILVPHKNPDGDALGSVSALMQFLRNIEKPHVAFCATTIPERLKYLSHSEYIVNDKNIWNEKTYDTIIVCDSGDLHYAGVDTYVNNNPIQRTIINIDHHPTNTLFGDINLVLPTASSTTEILYHFFINNNININNEVATCLLTGLITDTDNFTNAATSLTSYSIASDLIRRGGNLNLIRGWVFEDKSIGTLKLWGSVLSRLEKHPTLDIVYTYLTREDLEEHAVNDEEAEGLSNFLNNIGDGRAGLILKETQKNEQKGSFRTTRNDVDVSAFAKIFNGGGHKKAAGFSIKGTKDAAFEEIFTKITEYEKLITKN